MTGPVHEVEGQALPARRPWMRSLVLGVVILLSGVAIGGVTAAMVLSEPAAHDGSRWQERLPERIVERMRTQYGLTEEQAGRLLAIFGEHARKLGEIRAEVQPRVDAEHEALRREVESVLTPEQAQQWRAEYERKKDSWRSRGAKQPAPSEGQ